MRVFSEERNAIVTIPKGVGAVTSLLHELANRQALQILTGLPRWGTDNALCTTSLRVATPGSQLDRHPDLILAGNYRTMLVTDSPVARPRDIPHVP